MDDIGRRSGATRPAGGTPAVNTHVHVPPNFSAFDTAEAAVRAAAAEGVAAVGTSNYHDFGVYRRFAATAEEAGVVPLFGVEIITLDGELEAAGTLVNDPGNPGRMYLCGKALAAFDPPTPAGAARMAAMRAASNGRMRHMAALVAGCFEEAGLPGGPTDELIAEAVAARAGVPVGWVALQERHIARAFQELLFGRVEPADRPATLGRLFGRPAGVDVTDAVAVQEAIRSNLMKAGRPAFVAEAAVSFEDAYRLILELAGIPCYPILADGASPICPFEDPPEMLAERILERGIYAAELIPGRNRIDVVDRYVAVLRRAGIVVMAGTEHNTQRMIPLAPAALAGASLSDRSRLAFWEATCVVAAHQRLRASGEPGYVDDGGRLAAGFADGEARIRRFAQVGADVIAGRRVARVQA